MKNQIGKRGLKMYCGKCGTKIEKQDKFCGVCGKGALQSVNIVEARKGVNKRFIWIVPIICIIMIIFIIRACVSLSHSLMSESDVARDAWNNCEFFNIFEHHNMQLENYEITNRQTSTENGTDTVFISIFSTSAQLEYQADYVVRYRLFDDGWHFDRVEANSVIFVPTYDFTGDWVSTQEPVLAWCNIVHLEISSINWYAQQTSFYVLTLAREFISRNRFNEWYHEQTLDNRNLVFGVADDTTLYWSVDWEFAPFSLVVRKTGTYVYNNDYSIIYRESNPQYRRELARPSWWDSNVSISDITSEEDSDGSDSEESLDSMMGEPDYITIAGVQLCTSLTELNLAEKGLTDVDIVQLRYMRNLNELNLTDNFISDLSPLAGLTNLEKLYLGANQVSDLSPLAGLTNLELLWLWNNQISDLSPLAGLTNLEWLGLAGNQISDLSPLAGLTNLKWLFLLDNQISDLSPLAGLMDLFGLYLSENQISDLSPLAGLTNLEILDVSENQINDFSYVEHVPDLQY